VFGVQDSYSVLDLSRTEKRALVKNGFSDPTKVQKGQDRQRKDVEGDRQGKALKEGCCERRWARMSVSSREEINTNRNLVESDH